MKRGEGGRQMERKGGKVVEEGTRESRRGVRRGEQSETGISGSFGLMVPRC